MRGMDGAEASHSHMKRLVWRDEGRRREEKRGEKINMYSVRDLGLEKKSESELERR